MHKNNFTLLATSDMFGTTVFLQDDATKNIETVSTNLGFNPLDMLGDVDNGYLFRSPDITLDILDYTLKGFDALIGPLSLVITKDDTGKYEALAEIQNKSDAAMFAWSNLSHWQKWSRKQSEDLEKERETKKPAKATVNPDGSVRVTVTVEELQDEDD